VNDHYAAGRGTVDWDGVFQGLKKHKFSGYLAIDVGMVPDLEVQYRESYEFLRSMAAKYAL
jgi:sugar phosphate isomerase/epimerase